MIAPQLPTFSFEQAAERIDRFDVVVAGPGLAAEDVEAAVPLVSKASRVVLDAGGLTPEVIDAATDGGAEVVLTPHQGEFKRIAGVGGGAYSTRALANKRGLTVLLKGNPTLITDGGSPGGWSTPAVRNWPALGPGTCSRECSALCGLEV